MKSASQSISKCLIALAAILTPWQPLQAMHLLCNECVESREIEGELDSQSCECKHSSARNEGTRVYDGCLPLAPCSCPPTCVCKQPSHPRILIREQTKIERCSTLFSDAPISVEKNLKPENRQNEIKFSLTLSARQVCVSLCRFLA